VWLVDTSVWVEVFARPPRLRLEDELPLDEVVTALPIVQEVLQGLRDERAFRVARDSMLAFQIVEPQMRADLFIEAAQLYRTARRAGFTVRSSVDCLIAACAVRNHVGVLHSDRDFDALARIAPLESRNITRLKKPKGWF
jgi:predicted nucleic acid-binding protein